MSLSRTFAKQVVATASFTALMLSIWLLVRVYPAESTGLNPSDISIYYTWKSPDGARMLESRITAVVENWLASMDGIASIYSETSDNSGKILVELKENTDPAAFISVLEYNFQLKRHELPKNFGGFQYDHRLPGHRVFEFYLPDLSGESRKQLHQFLSSIEGISEISIPENELMLKTYIANPALWKFRDSTMDIPGRNFVKLPGYSVNSASLQSNYLAHLAERMSGNTHPRFQSQTRINGIPAVKITLRYSGISERELLSRLEQWPSFTGENIHWQPSPVVHGYEMPFMLVILLVVFIFSIIDLPRSKNRRISACIGPVILMGAALLLWETASGKPGDLAFMGGSLLAAILLFYSKHSARLTAKVKASSIIPVAALIFAGHNSRFFLLLLPWIGLLMAQGRVDNPSNSSSSRTLNNYRTLVLVLALSVLLLFVLPPERSPVLIRDFKEMPRQVYDIPDHTELPELVAHLFLDDHNSSFSGDFLNTLEADILKLTPSGGKLFTEIQSARKVRFSIKADNSALIRIRTKLARLSLQTSGITWFINHGEYNYSNRSSPMLPSFRWTIKGYNMDSLNSYGRIIRQMLNATPRVQHVRPFSLSLFPDIQPPVYREKWRKTISPDLSRVQTYEFRDSRDLSVHVSTSPYSRWRLYHETAAADGMKLRGKDLIVPNEHKNENIIIKKNRNYLWSIGHEFQGTRKMSEEFFSGMYTQISGILPPGFSIENGKRPGHVSASKADHQLILIWLILVIWPVLYEESWRPGIVNTIRLGILLILSLVWFDNSDTLPTTWRDSIFIAAEIWLLFGSAKICWRPFMVIAMSLVLHGEEISLWTGIIVTGAAYVLTFPASRWSEAGSSLLRIWRGHQVYQRN